MVEKKAAIERKPLLRGVTKAARRLWCSQTHLSRVMYGERKPGRDLERRMRRLGLVPGSAGKGIGRKE